MKTNYKVSWDLKQTYACEINKVTGNYINECDISIVANIKAYVVRITYNLLPPQVLLKLTNCKIQRYNLHSWVPIDIRGKTTFMLYHKMHNRYEYNINNKVFFTPYLFINSKYF